MTYLAPVSSPKSSQINLDTVVPRSKGEMDPLSVDSLRDECISGIGGSTDGFDMVLSMSSSLLWWW